MRVLVIGSGGREHALVWKIAQSEAVSEVVCAPGNAGIAAEPKTRCLQVAVDDLSGLIALAREQRPELVVVGPEAPLVAGLADRLTAEGFAVFGPNERGAQLEGSKAWAKDMLRRSGVPTADYGVFSEPEAARRFVREHPGRWVVKADGLAAGKGVLLCQSTEEALEAIERLAVAREFGPAGERLVIEAYLDGEEASCLALTDGREVLLLASSQDHKRALDGDRGPNTGGMGAYSPAPVVDERLEALILERVFRPVVAGLRAEGIDYRGVLYAGLMIGPAGPQVLEFNVRFGDPETQALLPRLRSDLVPALLAAARGELGGVRLEWEVGASVCVVMASGGYPGRSRQGVPITGLERAREVSGAVVFHAGTRRDGERLVTAGGRVLNVCARGVDVRQAVDRAYRAVRCIEFEGAQYRRDIAHRALGRRT